MAEGQTVSYRSKELLSPHRQAAEGSAEKKTLGDKVPNSVAAVKASETQSSAQRQARGTSQQQRRALLLPSPGNCCGPESLTDLQLAGKSMTRNGVFAWSQSITEMPVTEGKVVTLQQGNLADTTLTKRSKFTSPVMRQSTPRALCHDGLGRAHPFCDTPAKNTQPCSKHEKTVKTPIQGQCVK